MAFCGPGSTRSSISTFSPCGTVTLPGTSLHHYLKFYHKILRCRIRTCLRGNFVQNIFLFCRFSAYFHLLKSWWLIVEDSVPDPWRFYTDSDPRIHTTGLQIRIRILLFSSMAFKISTKMSFFPGFLLGLLQIRIQVIKTSQNKSRFFWKT